ncbi:MAG TPA: YggT family protein [Gammaproteobacteria bacterium]|nr:YggT family protein [Gammaproteobacteria bacterium]
MFMSSLQNALIFTIHTIFSTYIIIVLFRFMLQLVRADFYNPLAQVAIRITNPLLVPLRRIIPGYAKIDVASLVLALLLQGVELYAILITKGFSVAPSTTSILGLFIWSSGELLDLFLVFLFFATLIQAIASWVQPGQYNPGVALFSRITDPFFNPIRRVLPDFGMLDFAPLVGIFVIYLTRMIIANPIIFYGRGLI